MIKLFKRNQPNIILFILFTGILLWVPLFVFKPEQLQVELQYSGIIKRFYLFLNERYFLRNFLSMLLLFAISLLLSRLNTRFLFINFRTQMPGYWFVLLTAPFLYLFDLFPQLLAALFVVFSLYKLFESYDKKSMAFELIDAGFLISMGSLFYPPAIYLHLFLFIALLVLQDYNGKEWFLVVIGALIPFAIMWSISYTFDSDFQKAYSEIFLRSGGIENLNTGSMIFLFSVIALMVLSSLHMIGVFNLKKVSSRRLFSAQLTLFVVTIVLCMLFLRISFLIVAIIPLTYLFTHYFYLIKKIRLGNILFYFMLISVILSIVNTIFPGILNT